MDACKLNQALEESKITKRELASRAKISRVTLDALLRGADTKISTLEQVAGVLGVKVSELFDPSPPKKPAVVPVHDDAGTITYYPSMSGAAGDIPFTEDNELEHLAMQVPTFEDCRLAVNVYGNSMAPGIKSGDIVLMAEWRERYIEWGNIYLVVTRSGHRVIKRLYRSDDEQCIECRSDNSEASPPFKVDKDDILHLYLVKGHISRDAM